MSDFHMVVCVKAVPGSTEVKMDPKTNTIVRDGKQTVINPFDASALECALALKDDFIGFGMDVRVTVVSMGIPATELLLRDCIARGADDALLLTDRAFAGADTLATTYALKCGIEALDEDFDLLICGKMAVDGDTAQIGPELAGAFEIPCVTDVSCVQSAGFTTCGSLALVHGCDAGEGAPGDAVRDDDCQGDWPVAYAEYCRYSRGGGGGRARGQCRRRERRPRALRSCRVADTGRALVCARP